MFITLSFLCSPTFEVYLVRYAVPFYILSSIFNIAVSLRLEECMMTDGEKVKKVLID